MSDTKQEKAGLIAERVGRLAPGQALAPRNVRIVGAAFLAGSALLAAINAWSLQEQQIWPKAMLASPMVLLLGLWLLIDARALAAGTRRHQQAILWTCVGVGSAIGLALIHAITGRFFP